MYSRARKRSTSSLNQEVLFSKLVRCLLVLDFSIDISPVTWSSTDSSCCSCFYGFSYWWFQIIRELIGYSSRDLIGCGRHQAVIWKPFWVIFSGSRSSSCEVFFDFEKTSVVRRFSPSDICLKSFSVLSSAFFKRIFFHSSSKSRRRRFNIENVDVKIGLKTKWKA